MKDEALRLALETLEKIHNHPKSFWNCMDEITAIKQALEQPEPEPEGEQHMIYMTFDQWADGNFLEIGEPRREAYSKAERDLVEMGWNYGYDAGVQWQKSQQALDRMAENERELGIQMQPEPVIDKPAAIRIATALGWEPKREWQGLTDEDEIDWEEGGSLRDLVKAIEAKLKEKNNV